MSARTAQGLRSGVQSVETYAPEVHHTTSGGNGARPKPLLALIPAYNEERFIGSVVLRARQYADQVIVVDDGSTDATAAVAQAAGAVVMRQGANRGKAAALARGFEKARELQPEVLIVLDGDGQHQPDDIPQVAAPVLRGAADIVVGSRYLLHADGVPRHRVLGHWAFTLMTNYFSGVRITDSQSGFRAFSERALEVLAFQSDGFSVESEMQFLAHEHGLRVEEVAIRITYLDPPKRSVIAQGLAVLHGVVQMAIEYRPLLLLGLSGSFALLIGLIFGASAIHALEANPPSVVAYALAALFLCVVGPITIFTGIILHAMRGVVVRLLRAQREADSSTEDRHIEEEEPPLIELARS